MHKKLWEMVDMERHDKSLANKTTPNAGGEVTHQLAQQEGSRPGIGEHVSNPNATNDDPHDTPRLGVGNQAQDTPAEHGEFVGGLIGIGCEDDRDN